MGRNAEFISWLLLACLAAYCNSLVIIVGSVTNDSARILYQSPQPTSVVATLLLANSTVQTYDLTADAIPQILNVDNLSDDTVYRVTFDVNPTLTATFTTLASDRTVGQGLLILVSQHTVCKCSSDFAKNSRVITLSMIWMLRSHQWLTSLQQSLRHIARHCTLVSKIVSIRNGRHFMLVRRPNLRRLFVQGAA